MIRKSAGEVASCKRLCETGLEKQPVLQPVLALKRVVEISRRRMLLILSNDET
jgi:hypothetical protein